MDFWEYDTRLAAYAVIVDPDDRLLLTWFNGSGLPDRACWTLPGGGVEYEESLAEAVVREVREESGYVVDVGTPLAVDTFTEQGLRPGGRPYKAVRVLFDAQVVGGRLGTTEIAGSTDFAQWVPLADIPTLERRADIIDIAIGASGRGR